MRPKLLVLVLCVVGILSLFFMLSRQVPEPMYEGRPLSEWVVRSFTPQYHRDDSEVQRGTHAIREIGTNAIPHLLRWIRHEEHPWKTRLREITSERLGRHFFNSRDPFLGYCAVLAFGVLAPVPDQTIEQLARLARKTESRDVAVRALEAMGLSRNSNAIPPLVEIIMGHQTELRGSAALAFRHMGEIAEPAVPVLLQCLNDQDTDVAINSLLAIEELALKPELVVPALIDALNDPRPAIRGFAARALGQYGREGLPAVPALLNALQADDVADRLNARDALLRIQPESLRKTPSE
jgi:hypothetical protein